MTYGNDERPTRRVLISAYDHAPYVVELRAGLILIRPKGARRGGKSEAAIPVGAAYLRGMQAQLESEKRSKRKLKVVRGTRIGR